MILQPLTNSHLCTPTEAFQNRRCEDHDISQDHHLLLKYVGRTKTAFRRAAEALLDLFLRQKGLLGLVHAALQDLGNWWLSWRLWLLLKTHLSFTKKSVVSFLPKKVGCSLNDFSPAFRQTSLHPWPFLALVPCPHSWNRHQHGKSKADRPGFHFAAARRTVELCQGTPSSAALSKIYSLPDLSVWGKIHRVFVWKI